MMTKQAGIWAAAVLCALQADINAATGCGSNIVANPLMQGPDANGGFRLLETSPCLNAGVSYPAAITDFYGNAHGLRNGWDIGSTEWYPPSGTIVHFR